MAQREDSELYPARFLTDGAHPEKTSNPPDLLILNQPITHFTAFSRLWEHTGYRICADGGANRLFDMLKDDLIEQRERYVSRMVIIRVCVNC
jgi:thiamine pyrophosphokinase